MKAAADLYTDKMSLQAIADALSLNSIKVRKLLITAGVYESDTAKLVRKTFHSFRETQDYSTAVTSTMSALQLSRPSVTAYLPYEKACASRKLLKQRILVRGQRDSATTELWLR